MNILIIGGAGYIGSHVAREFLDQGHRVTVFDNLSSGLRKNLFPEGNFIHGDILNYPDLLRAALGKTDRLQPGPKSGVSGGEYAKGGFDAIIHLAAFKAAGESMVKPEKYSVNNISGTVNILNAAAEAGIPNIVFSSSAAVYGEPAYLPIDEKHPTKPENYYGFTKLEIEGFLDWYDRLKGIHFAALRYFNAAGYDVKGRITGLEQNPANLLPVIMEGAAGIRPEIQIFGNDYDTPDGTCIRDYIHVSDLATGHVAALNYISRNNKSLKVNLGSETGFSVLEILETARKVSGQPVPAKIVGRRPGDPAKLTASAQLAKETLGWTAKHSDPETLIKTTWEVYKKN
ncbi:UDP-glucose 4-epimerase GalE [Spirochaetia bacterium]|nr:UDP-glucose 4-epimerase GalE [Spirochaetia bacterium]